MKIFIVFASVLAVTFAGGLPGGLVYARAPIVHHQTQTQYHTQDELGQYSYGYSGGPSAKQETKTADGITRGSYSYVDANGLVQHVNYVSDPVNGFRAAGTNFPVGPAATVPVAQQVIAPVVHQQQVIAAAPANVNFANAAPIPQAGNIYYAPSPIARPFQTAAAPQVQTLQFGGHHGVPAGPQRISYPQAPLVRQVSAGFGGPVYTAQLPVPVDDTYEVKAAKAAHFRAYNDALARTG